MSEDSDPSCPECGGPVDLVEQEQFQGGFLDDVTVHVQLPVCRNPGCHKIKWRAGE